MLLGRKLLLVTVGILLLILFGGMAIHGDLPAAWRAVGVPAMSPTFADTRTITHSIDCKQLGYDPYVTTKCDPWGRYYNYPPIWLELGRFSVSSASTNIMGFLIAAVFVLTLLLLADLRRWPSALILVIAFLSPPVLLGMERGNTDLLIFALVCLLFYTVSLKPPINSALVSAGAILLTVLKVYPVIIAATLINSRRNLLLVAAVSLAAIAMLTISSGEQFRYLLLNQPEDTWRSFGSIVVLMRLMDMNSDPVLRLVATLAAIGVGLLSLFFCYRVPWFSKLVILDQATRQGRIAVASSLIFLGCFLLHNNYDYRLVFLLPFIFSCLERFERSSDLYLLIAPVTLSLYLWLVPLNSWISDIFSLLVFSIVFAAVGMFFLPVIQRGYGRAFSPTLSKKNPLVDRI